MFAVNYLVLAGGSMRKCFYAVIMELQRYKIFLIFPNFVAIFFLSLLALSVTDVTDVTDDR